MLQIITGKFFKTDDCSVTRQRAALYANYHTLWDIETVVGALRVTNVMTRTDMPTYIYEFDQRIEKDTVGGIGTVAVAPDTLINDFAAVVSFALNVTCTPDVELARRLTQSKYAALGVPHPPHSYVTRVFDPWIDLAPGDADQVQDLIRRLVALERKTFEAVIGAIRRFVTGLHRLGEDPDLAYTLLVASMESLVHDFDAYIPRWLDFPKHDLIDAELRALKGEKAERVREVLLKGEHLAVTRRFQEFTLAHIQSKFYREEAKGRLGPIGCSDLAIALKRAYEFRSSYVHRLQALPRLLTLIEWGGESLIVDGKPALTFQGLTRVARSVITEFMARCPKTERENFDWRSALPGHLQFPWHTAKACYWVGRKENFSYKTARRYLAGFLSEVQEMWLDRTQALPDIREVLRKIEQIVAGLARKNRLAMLAMYLFWHKTTHLDLHCAGWQSFIERFIDDFNKPSLEGLLVHALLDEPFPWPSRQRDDLWGKYRRQRYHANGLRIPVVLEAAMALSLAEAARREGDVERARSLVTEAVNDLPGNERLVRLESEFGSADQAISWRTVLFPKTQALPV